MSESVREWLASIGCEQYANLLEGSGYPTVSSLTYLNDAQLQSLGVYDANHRGAILRKAGSAVDDDFDNMLGDLTSVIKDLETFSVPTKIDTTTLSTNSATSDITTKSKHDVRHSYVPPVPNPKPETDFDLDSLLTDLSSFNPTEVVGATKQEPTPTHVPQYTPTHSQPTPPMQPSPAHQRPVPAPRPTPPQRRTPQTTPHHNHMAPTPPTTPGHSPHLPHTPVSPRTPTTPGTPGSPQRSYTEVMDRGQVPEVILRSHSESGRKEPIGGAEGDNVTVVPQPDLAGATEKISQEEMQDRLQRKALELMNDPSLTEVEREEKLKEEKIRIGIEKMRIAHKKRVAIEVYNPDRSKKTVVVEEGMSSNMVCHLLVVKNHFDESPNWVLVEQLGDVSLERELEDHENIVEVYSSWPREHNNVFLFKQNERKYDLFEDPMKYFPGHLHSSQAAQGRANTLERAEKARKILLQEYFSSTSRVPELEGFLHLKDGYKKGWKKYYFILRASGLYYSNKGKNKTAKHLIQLVHFEECELYHGINFKKTLKAPTQYCFAMRPLPKQFIPGPKDIKVLCADDEPTALSWTAGIRLAKYGLQLRDNYHRAKMTQFKLEDLTAPDGSKKAEDRASKLIGMRLERHMEKIREQYKVHRDEEEQRRRVYRDSPNVPGRGIDGNKSSQSTTPSQTPDQTPDASPMHSRHAPPQTNGISEPQLRPPQQTPYNPYPPPSQPAPQPRVSPTHVPAGSSSPRQAPPVAPRPPRQQPPQQFAQPPQQFAQPPQPQPPPVQPRAPSPPKSRPSPSPERENLFAFAWYHGTIPRDEAIRRLEAVGGFDGCYLVRDSTTVSNSYVLTMFAKGTSKNFQIMPVEHPSGLPMYRIDDGPSFANVDQLLRHYKQDSDRLPCRLTEFCPRPPTRIAEC